MQYVCSDGGKVGELSLQQGGIPLFANSVHNLLLMGDNTPQELLWLLQVDVTFAVSCDFWQCYFEQSFVIDPQRSPPFLRPFSYPTVYIHIDHTCTSKFFWPATHRSYNAVPLWLLQVWVAIKGCWGYFVATALCGSSWWRNCSKPSLKLAVATAVLLYTCYMRPA